MNKPELQLGNPLQLLARFFNLRRAQPRDLDKNMIISFFGYNRFADPKFVHPFPDHLDGLLLHLWCDRARFTSLFGDRWYQPYQKRGPHLQVKPEMNLLLEWQKRID